MIRLAVATCRSEILLSILSVWQRQNHVPSKRLVAVVMLPSMKLYMSQMGMGLVKLVLQLLPKQSQHADTTVGFHVQDHVEAFKQREKVPARKERKSASLDTVPTFLNGRHLRDYQVCSEFVHLRCLQVAC